MPQLEFGVNRHLFAFLIDSGLNRELLRERNIVRMLGTVMCGIVGFDGVCKGLGYVLLIVVGVQGELGVHAGC